MINRPTKWGVGMVATHRPTGQSRVGQSIDSLAVAGFDTIQVFYDTDRSLGALANYERALSGIAASYPEADAYVIVEDDIVCARNLRDYLERSLWVAEAAYYSCFTPADYRGRVNGWSIVRRGIDTYMAQFYVFQRASALEFLSDFSKLPLDMSAYKNSADCVLGLWAESRGLPVYYHTPSLVEHTGAAIGSSAIGNDGHVFQRVSDDFIGEDASCLDVPVPRRIPAIEVFTNSYCHRSCYSCDKQPLMRGAPDYEFTPDAARSLVASLVQHNVVVDRITLAGGEPVHSRYLKDNILVLRDTPNIHQIQLSTALPPDVDMSFFEVNVDVIMVSDYGNNLVPIRQPEFVERGRYHITDKLVHIAQPRRLLDGVTPGQCRYPVPWLYDNRVYPCPMAKPASIRLSCESAEGVELDEYIRFGKHESWVHGNMSVCRGCYLNERVAERMKTHPADKAAKSLLSATPESPTDLLGELAYQESIEARDE